MLVVCLSFTGCGNLGNAIISALSLDVTVDDPALIKVEDILDKTVKTESVKSGDFTYTLYTDNTACITGYTGSNPVVSIPAEIDGAKVVGLENKALKSSSTLKELILPDSVEAIGNYAAMYCDSLEKVTIGKNIKHIGISAFEGSQENAYTGKSKLTTVVFNGAPKTISEKAFYFCSALTEIVLPEGVETIGDWAFAKCFSAKKIIIPEGVTQIDDHAFLKCTGAVEISIPGTVESIAVSTFYRCSSLEKLTIGEGVKKLEKGAFEECKSLKTVVLPESMEELGKYAFYNCYGLDEITVHSGVKVFGGEIFKDVGKLTISTESGSDARNTRRTTALMLPLSADGGRMGTIIALGGGVMTTARSCRYLKNSPRIGQRKSSCRVPADCRARRHRGRRAIWESFEKLGCTVETLKLTDPTNTREHIYDTLVSTDIVYAGGGNLEFMMNTFKATARTRRSEKRINAEKSFRGSAPAQCAGSTWDMTTAAKTAASCSSTASDFSLLLLPAFHQRTLAEFRDSRNRLPSLGHRSRGRRGAHIQRRSFLRHVRKRRRKRVLF